jgi:hypothetical protein
MHSSSGIRVVSFEKMFTADSWVVQSEAILFHRKEAKALRIAEQCFCILCVTLRLRVSAFKKNVSLPAIKEWIAVVITLRQSRSYFKSHSNSVQILFNVRQIVCVSACGETS